MTRRKASIKSNASGLLQRLSPEEASAILSQLLDNHPELRSEAAQLATELVSSSSSEDIAPDVYGRITDIDIEALNERAGTHSWGYVEPSEGAIELLGEAIEDLIEDMKRKAELRLIPAAEVVCVGIVEGLYQARNVQSDGALGWAPDFPGEEAEHVVGEFLRSCPQSDRKAVRQDLMETLAKRVPEWSQDLKRTADQVVEG